MIRKSENMWHNKTTFFFIAELEFFLLYFINKTSF